MVSGEDFTVRRTSTGYYTVTFASAFAAIGGASATQMYGAGGDTRHNLVINTLTTVKLSVHVGDNNGKDSDRAFTFVVVGSVTGSPG